MRKIGLLGGSFDPPHSGHIHIANLALKKFKLNSVWFLVAKKNPFKSTKSSSKDRMQLVQSKIIRNKKFHTTNIEEKINPSCQTSQTVKRLKQIYKKTNFFWIAGLDNIEKLNEWNNIEYLLKNAKFCIFIRSKNWHKLLRHKNYAKYKKYLTLNFNKINNQSSTQIRMQQIQKNILP